MILPLTGGERISDTVKFKHHAISILKLTPKDRILESDKHLDAVIKKQQKNAPMDEITAIEFLQENIMGEKKYSLPPNSAQCRKAKQEMQARSLETIQVPLPIISAPRRGAAQKDMAGNNKDGHMERQQEPVHVATYSPEESYDDDKRLPRPVYVSNDKEE